MAPAWIVVDFHAPPQDEVTYKSFRKGAKGFIPASQDSVQHLEGVFPGAKSKVAIASC
jgi:hypothetical protein